MPTLKNYYFILGVQKNASPVEIEAAYESHSAAAGYDAFQASLMPDVTEAYRCLSDPALRREYDDSFGEPPRVCSSGNVHNFKSHESSVTLELEFQKRRRKENFRGAVLKNVILAVIFLALAGAAINYGPKYFRGKNIPIKTDSSTAIPLPAAPGSEPRAERAEAETDARAVRMVGEKPKPRPYAIQTGGVVTRDRSECRAKPSETSDIVAVMRKDTPIFVTQEVRGGDGSVWYYVTNSRFRGWVNGRDVKVHKF
ncbi:MAG: J domain-containing protein [Synergistaceae bacterium]|jgi:curved DNA-binding protein CbpA|nr:J domain-containing protein [Synergistaceae bacterium]MDR1515524.1 J domain-containing protein [Synergistaceae bacterium]